MKTTLFLSFVLALFLTACGADEGSVDSDGNCTQRFVDDYNAIINNVLEMNKTRNPDQRTDKLRTASEACDNFFTKHANVTCKATLSGESQVQVKSESIRRACENLKHRLPKKQA